MFLHPNHFSLLYRHPLNKFAHAPKFDDLAARLLVLPTVANPVPTLYDLVYFQAFNVDNNSEGPLYSHSRPKIASSDAVQDVIGAEQPAFKVNYTGSQVKSFTLKTLHLGCVANSGGLVGAPVGCTVQFTGYKLGTGAEVTQLVTFAPNTLLGDETVLVNIAANMTQGIFSSDFQNVTKVDSAMVDSSLLPAGLELAIDDVEYDIYLELVVMKRKATRRKDEVVGYDYPRRQME